MKINFLSFNDASVSNIFPTPCLFNSEFSKLFSLNVPFSLIARCSISKSIVPNFLIFLFQLEEYMWIMFVEYMVLYQLPKLSYEYDELEPFFDAETMKIHHTKHHQSYVDGLNKSLIDIRAESHPKYISAILSELTSIPESGRSAINFFGGGFENHRLFWETLIPNGDKTPGGTLEDQIDVYFDNFNNFKKNIFRNSPFYSG